MCPENKNPKKKERSASAKKEFPSGEGMFHDLRQRKEEGGGG